MLIVKLTVISLCAVLKLIGELWWHNAQRWILPAVLGAGVSIATGVWWLGILVYPCAVTIDLGYKTYGPSNGFDRGAWLAVICVVAGLGCAILHHLSLVLYVPYFTLGGIWGGVTRNWLNLVIAPLTGTLIGSLVFLVH